MLNDNTMDKVVLQEDMIRYEASRAQFDHLGHSISQEHNQIPSQDYLQCRPIAKEADMYEGLFQDSHTSPNKNAHKFEIGGLLNGNHGSSLIVKDALPPESSSSKKTKLNPYNHDHFSVTEL